MAYTLVGIAGKKRHGKDTFGTLLHEELNKLGHRVVHRHLAEALKEEAAKFIAPAVKGIQWQGIYKEMIGNDDRRKEFWRPLMQFWGDLARQQDGRDKWVKALDKSMKKELGGRGFHVFATVNDCRYSEEIDWIKAEGGMVIRVIRPGASVSDEHQTETALDNYNGFNFVVVNDGTIEDMRAQASNIAAAIVATKMVNDAKKVQEANDATSSLEAS